MDDQKYSLHVNTDELLLVYYPHLDHVIDYGQVHYQCR